MKLLPLVVLYTSFTSLNAQPGSDAVGGRSWGLGNATVALVHGQSFFSNPAGLGFEEINYANSSFDSRFDIVGLSTVSLCAALKGRFVNIGVGAERFGDKYYNENKIGLAVAKNTGRVSLGLKASYLGAMVENLSSHQTILTEFGVLAKLSSKVSIGLHAANLTGATLYPAYDLPFRLHLGASFSPIKQLIILAESETTLGQNHAIKAGLEYKIHEKVSLRTGINTGVRSNHFGVGFEDKRWRIDYAVNSHPALAMSHHFSLQMNLGSIL